jgi:hypothetical protein
MESESEKAHIKELSDKIMERIRGENSEEAQRIAMKNDRLQNKIEKLINGCEGIVKDAEYLRYNRWEDIHHHSIMPADYRKLAEQLPFLRFLMNLSAKMINERFEKENERYKQSINAMTKIVDKIKKTRGDRHETAYNGYLEPLNGAERNALKAIEIYNSILTRKVR